MDGKQAGAHPFLAVGLGPDGLRLRAVRALAGAVPLVVFCRGIEVGRRMTPGPLDAGEAIAVPVARLPRVPLPAELRLASGTEAPDLVAPWRIETGAAALSLLGPPEIQVEDLRLDHGVLRGTAREARNGLLDPVVYARVNGAGLRMAVVEPPAGLPEGGCAFRFSLPIEAADLTEWGLSVQLYLAGQEAPIAGWSWTRGVGEAERRVAEFEGRLRQLEEEVAAGQQALQAAMQRQVALQQDRIDAFIAAASTLMLDRLAAAPGGGPDALRSLMEAAAPAADAAPDAALAGRQLRLGPEDGLFGTGWHGAEVDPGGAFRWMAGRGLLLNPAPDRPLAEVTLRLCHLYRAAEPALTALLDETPAEVAAVPLEGGGHLVRLRPAGGPRPVRLLRLASLTGGNPAEDGVSADRRRLSFAVSAVTFDYAD